MDVTGPIRPDRAVLGQLMRFVVVGVVNFALFAVSYLLLRLLLDSTVANVTATLVTTITGTRANGRVMFGAGEVIGLCAHLKGLAITGLGLVITTMAVDLLAAGRGQVLELVVLTGAGAVSGCLRFLLLRHWVFDSTAADRFRSVPSPRISQAI